MVIILNNKIKRYYDLVNLETFDERFNYLKLTNFVGDPTFGFDRVFNQKFYNSKEWKDIRDYVIVRDLGCDLGIKDRPIYEKILIHHMNPITLDDINYSTDFLLNPEYLICVSHDTHNAIHYGTSNYLNKNILIEREKNDTCPWKK